MTGLLFVSWLDYPHQVVSKCPEGLPQTIATPQLTPQCIRLMSEEATAEEGQLWRSLGGAWNIPRWDTSGLNKDESQTSSSIQCSYAPQLEVFADVHALQSLFKSCGYCCNHDNEGPPTSRGETLILKY